MTGHDMQIEWDGDLYTTYRVICREPAEAPCRFEFDCHCEEYYATGVDADGPWHALTDGYLTNDESARTRSNPDERPRHRGKHGGECTYQLWMQDTDVQDLGNGIAHIPVTFTWDGEYWEWHVAQREAATS